MSDIELQPPAVLATILADQGLTRDQTARLFGQIMDGELDDPLKAGLLVALAAKGESAEEIAGAAIAMRGRVVPVRCERKGLVDTCGTGGDRKGTFNISTAAALVAAAADVPIAKHGNRAVSSRSGSADVFGALGVEIEMSPVQAGRALDEIGLAFLFAPGFHPAMREVMPVRRSLGIRTIFNLLGPLTNPAGARRQVLGVYEAELVPRMAQVLASLGCDHALVVHGEDGLDELTTTAATLVAEVKGPKVETFRLTPESLGLARVEMSALAGGDAESNAKMMRAVLQGEPGPLADITALNAAAALYVGGRVGDLREGLERARDTLTRGEGLTKLEELREFSTRTGDDQA
ncbi:MAG: anthranilate phosphoribosyltransferase [Thermoanaerobaculia bacterium]|jgi:anthranilate phosphoribosyltransferase